MSTQQIYNVVLDIRATLPIPDIRWTHFQDPPQIEDALGHKFPFPSELQFDALEAVLKCHFKDGIGSTDVSAGNYELCKAHNRSDVITADTRFIPGTGIVMAILVNAPMVSDSPCPMPGCQSSEATPCPGGGFRW